MPTVRKYSWGFDSEVQGGIQRCSFLTSYLWAAHQTSRNMGLRLEESTIPPKRIRDEGDPELPLKQGFILELALEFLPYVYTLASTLKILIQQV